MSGVGSVAPAIAMLGAFVCLVGGAVMIFRRSDVRRGVLLLVMAVVLIGNVAIWTL